MVKKLILGGSEETFYSVYTNLINMVYKLNMTDTQMQVFAELLYQNNKFNHIPESERDILIFSSTNRKEMINRLDINVGTFNNTISLFRKMDTKSYGKIMTGTTINRAFLVNPEKENEISIIFRLKT